MKRTAIRRRGASLLLVTLVAAGSAASSACASTKTAKSSSATVIAIKDFAFKPEKLTAKVGQPISVVNSDRFPHTLTADNKSFNTAKMDGGAKKTITIAKAGTYKFHCEIHQYMKGTITVK